MADPANDPLRWREPEKALVRQYLDDGRMDPTRVNSASYLRSLKMWERLWAWHPNRNFYEGVRRVTAIWLAAQPRGGGRRPPPADGGASESEAEDEAEADSEYETNEAEDPPQSRPPPPQPARREARYSHEY